MGLGIRFWGFNVDASKHKQKTADNNEGAL